MHTPRPTPLAISYRSHQKSLAHFSYLVPLILFFFTKRQSQKGEGAWQNAPLNYALVFTFRPIKVLMVDFRKKGLDKKKVFVVHGEAPYFSEALSFSLPSLLVNPAMGRSHLELFFEGGQSSHGTGGGAWTKKRRDQKSLRTSGIK